MAARVCSRVVAWKDESQDSAFPHLTGVDPTAYMRENKRLFTIKIPAVRLSYSLVLRANI